MLRRIWSPCIPWKKPWQFYFACNSFDHQTLYKMVGARCSFFAMWLLPRVQKTRGKNQTATDYGSTLSDQPWGQFCFLLSFQSTKIQIIYLDCTGRKRQALLIMTKRQAGFVDKDENASRLYWWRPKSQGGLVELITLRLFRFNTIKGWEQEKVWQRIVYFVITDRKWLKIFFSARCFCEHFFL